MRDLNGEFRMRLQREAITGDPGASGTDVFAHSKKTCAKAGVLRLLMLMSAGAGQGEWSLLYASPNRGDTLRGKGAGVL
jgi:hypothetical protein